jgi:hypothetical protein
MTCAVYARKSIDQGSPDVHAERGLLRIHGDWDAATADWRASTKVGVPNGIRTYLESSFPGPTERPDGSVEVVL